MRYEKQGVKKANTTRIVKKANSYLVVETIKNYEYVTMESIISNTGLSRPTVLKILKELTEKQLVKKAGFAESDVGRAPVLYALNTEAYVAIGVDIDGPPVYLAVSDLSGKVLVSSKFELAIDSSIEVIQDTIELYIKKALAELNINRDKVLGIGLGLPASVDINSNCALNVSRLQALSNAPIAKYLEEKLNIPVLVRNDAHLIGIAEKKRLENTEELLCVVHRTGIGLAIIMENKSYEGSTGNSGFIGHMTIDCQGRVCACGSKGCLEALASKRAIKEIYSERTGKRLGYRQVLKLAEENDKVAVEICEEAGYYLGIGIANVVKTLDIHNIVISDIRCNERHVFFKSIKRSLREHTDTFFKKTVKLYVGGLQESELALGGCNFVIDNFFVSPQLILKA